MNTIKVVAIGENENDMGDFLAYTVTLSNDNYAKGLHYSAVYDAAKQKGFANILVTDEREPLMDVFLNIVDWKCIPNLTVN